MPVLIGDLQCACISSTAGQNFFSSAVRHIACSLVLLASPDEISDANMKKQITVSTMNICKYFLLYDRHVCFVDDHKDWKSLARYIMCTLCYIITFSRV